MHKENIHLQEQILYEGKWLLFKTVNYMVKDKECVWEMVERPLKLESKNLGGVEIIPIIKQQNKQDQLVVIASFRIPLKKYILEFPAGILEDDDVEENAVRELKEETGYSTKRILKTKGMRQVSYVDPWKSTEKGYFIILYIDGDAQENINPQQDLEPEEDIKVLKLTLDNNLCNQLQEVAQENQYEIQSSLWTFALGYSFNSIINDQSLQPSI